MWCGRLAIVALVVTPATPATHQVNLSPSHFGLLGLGLDTYRSSDDVLVLNIDMAFEILSNIEASCSRIGDNADEITFDIYTEMKLRLAIRYIYSFLIGLYNR